jgi:hypothetical protein
MGGPPKGGGMMRSVKMRLPRMVERVARLSGSNALSKKQAQRMMALVSPWKSRPRMSESQAQTFLSQASGVLTSAQKAALQADRPGGGPGGRGPGGGGPGGGGPRGEGGPPGGGRGFGGPGGRGSDGRGPGGPGGGFGGGRRGGGEMQGQTPAQQNAMRTMMASFNPLYTGSAPQMAGMPERMQQGMQRRRDRLNAALSQLQQRAR